MIRRIARNLSWVSLSNVALAGASFIALPLVLHAVGSRNYGVYAFLLGITALGGLAAGSLAIAATKTFAEMAARSPGRRSGSRFCSEVVALGLMAGTLPAVAMLVVSIAGWFGTRELPASVLYPLVAIMSVGELVSGARVAARSLLASEERYDLLAAIDICQGAITVVAALFVHWGYGGIALYAGLWVFAIVAGTAALHMLASTTEHYSIRPKWPSRRVRSTVDLAKFQGLNGIAHYLSYTADRLVLQAILGPTFVTQYAVAEKPNRLAEMTLSVPLTAAIPSFVKSFATERDDQVALALWRGTRVYLAAVLPVLLSLATWMDAAIGHWVGDQYLAVVDAARLFVVALVAASGLKVFAHLMLSKGRLREISFVNAGYAVVNVVGSAVLAGRIGLLGVVIPTAVFWIVVYPATWLWVMRDEGFAWLGFLAELCIMVGLGGLAATGSRWLFDALGVVGDSWFVALGLGGSTGFLVFLAVGMFAWVRDGHVPAQSQVKV